MVEKLMQQQRVLEMLRGLDRDWNVFDRTHPGIHSVLWWNYVI